MTTEQPGGPWQTGADGSEGAPPPMSMSLAPVQHGGGALAPLAPVGPQQISAVNEPARLSDILATLRRNWTVLVSFALVGLLLGVIAYILIPAKYSATSTVAITAMNLDPLSADANAASSLNMSGEATTARSDAVAKLAMSKMLPEHNLSSREIRDAVEVTTAQNAMLLTIDFTGDSAREAVAGADAVAAAFLEVRAEGAEEQITRLREAATKQLAALQTQSDATESEVGKRAVQVQSDAIASQLAALANLDLNPGRIVDPATTPDSPSTLGPVPLGLAGLFLGLLLALPFALGRKEKESTEIGSAQGMATLGDVMVLDGTSDAERSDTWNIAAFMLKIPPMDPDNPFVIMVDSIPHESSSVNAGQELADAIERRGHSVRVVDAGTINESKISRGWPTQRKRESWAGEIVVIDTSAVKSDANTVALATRVDAVVLARSTDDDAAALRRMAGLMRSKGVNVALAALFPPGPEVITLTY